MKDNIIKRYFRVIIVLIVVMLVLELYMLGIMSQISEVLLILSSAALKQVEFLRYLSGL